ncbi:hypothetical protein [Syntrophomonas palmitatica]|nr:hypothetical protein [Syntrophomonas palmitatica]
MSIRSGGKLGTILGIVMTKEGNGGTVPGLLCRCERSEAIFPSL